MSTVAQAKILILSLDVDAKAHVVTLNCTAQGNPVPEVKWTSSSGLLENGTIRTDLRSYSSSVTSSVPFSDQDVHTCQAVNSLGQDQITFPPDHSNCSFGLLVVTCFLGCLLFLGLVAFVVNVIKRSKCDFISKYCLCIFVLKWFVQILMCYVLFFPIKKRTKCAGSCAAATVRMNVIQLNWPLK